MKFFCLNLKTAVDRKLYSQKLFNEAGLTVQFYEGINGRALDLRHSKLNPGALGCYLSFMRLYEEIGRNNYGVTVIFEDDAVLKQNFKNQLNTALGKLPADWDIALIGWWPQWWNYEKLKPVQASPPFDASGKNMWYKFTGGGFWGTYGQVINGAKGARRLLDTLATITAPCDDQISEAVIAGKVNGYFLQRPIVDFARDKFKSQVRE